VQIPRGVHSEISQKDAYEQLRSHLGEVFKRQAIQKESRIEEGHLMSDHVHVMIAIPPKHAVSQVIGSIKGKSAIHLAPVYGERKRNFVGRHFATSRMRTSAWSRCAYGADWPPSRWPQNAGPREGPRIAALSGSQN
jgi:putative transposase